MFFRNIIFLRISSIVYLLFCLTLAGIMYFIVFGEMIQWGKNPPNSGYINFFQYLGQWWYFLPILSIINAIACPFFVGSIYLHFKYTNNRTFLKYTWFCLFNTIIEDFILLRPIFLILLIFKIWNKKNMTINKNNDYSHLNTRAVAICLFIIGIIIYFATSASFGNAKLIGWGSFCMVIYVIAPKLVINSYIDIKFSNINFVKKWIALYLTSSFFGLFPYCFYLSKNPIYENIIK